MYILVGIVAVLLIAGTLWDAFETMVLPRRVTRRFRVTNIVYRFTWIPWARAAHAFRPGNRRETFLSFYGPLVLLFLLLVWAVGLVVGFGLLQWAFGSPLAAGGRPISLGVDLYMSGTTFFTLGLGDVTPTDTAARVLTVIEAGIGFGTLAVVIGYLPVLYQAFSRREVNISLLDARAGSPPSAVELIRRHMRDYGADELVKLLSSWELWAAELMESHLSYPSLGYFRSQHENQSWLAALTTILDASALVMVGVEGVPARTARLTFAMARHAAVDLSQVANTAPTDHMHQRLTEDDFTRLRELLADAGAPFREGPAAEKKLKELRHLYEPYVHALSHRLLMPLPPWLPADDEVDAWRTSAWENL